jgi:hypothetical protein
MRSIHRHRVHHPVVVTLVPRSMHPVETWSYTLPGAGGGVTLVEAEPENERPQGKPDSETPPTAGSPTAAPANKDVKSLEEALETVHTARGPEHADTIAAMTKLASAYSADGSGRKAIKLGEEALALARRVLPAGDPNTAAAMKALIPLYKSVDLTEEAAKLEEELKALPVKP